MGHANDEHGDRGWLAVRLDDVDAVPFRDRQLTWRPLRAALGTKLIGMSAYTAAQAGQEIVEPHVESTDGRGHEEIYVVLSGRATFTLDGEYVDAPAGTFIRVADPGVHRQAVAEEPGTAVLALGGDPVFEPASSEWIDRARACLPDDIDRATTILADMPEDTRGAAVARSYGAAMIAAARSDRSGAQAAIDDAIAQSSDPQGLRELVRHDPLLAPLVTID